MRTDYYKPLREQANLPADVATEIASWRTLSRDGVSESLSVRSAVKSMIGRAVSDVLSFTKQLVQEGIGPQASALNGDIAIAAQSQGDQDIAVATLDPGTTLDLIVQFRDSFDGLLDADGQVHKWLKNQALTTAGSGLATASSGTSPAPTVPASVDIVNGEMALTVTFPAGTYAPGDLLTVTFDPATELGAAVLALAGVPVFTVTYTVIA